MWNVKLGAGKAIPTGGTGWRSFALALFLPLGNPKAVGFYVALLPAFMDVEKLSLAAALNFSIVIVVVWVFPITYFRGYSPLSWI